jgi:nicotinamidase-related amidase
MNDLASLDNPQGLKTWQHLCCLPEFPLVWGKTALLVIDLSYQQISREHGSYYKRIREAGLTADAEYAYSRIEQVVLPNVKRLIGGFRAHGAPVIYTTCASLRGDGSDQTWRHRSFGIFCRTDSKDAQIVEEVKPQDGDILLVKSGSSVFNSTNVEHILRNMGITTLVMTGVWTNSCVEGATRDAGDRDFRVVLAHDCCTAMSVRGERAALEYLDKNFCHVKSTDQILRQLDADTAAAGAPQK